MQDSGSSRNTNWNELKGKPFGLTMPTMMIEENAERSEKE